MMSRAVVVVLAGLVGVAAAGLLLGTLIPGAGGRLGPGSAWAVALACIVLAALIGAALTRRTPGRGE